MTELGPFRNGTRSMPMTAITAQAACTSEGLRNYCESSRFDLEPDSLPGDVGPSSMYAQKVAARDHSYASLRSRSLLIAAAATERMLRRQPCRQDMHLRVLTAWSNEILCSIDIPGTLSGFYAISHMKFVSDVTVHECLCYFVSYASQ